MRLNLETIVAHTLKLQPTSRRTAEQVIATIRVIARAVAADHALARCAATKAASPRRNLAEVRAVYVPPADLQQDSDVVAQSMPPGPIA